MTSVWIDHVSLSVADMAAARSFYERALAPLGIAMTMEVPTEFTDGVTVVGMGAGHPFFWLAEAGRQSPRTHLAFGTDSREKVDAFHAAALAAGGTDNGAPGLRPHYHENYYGAFVLDPEGHNIEAVCHRPATS